VISFLRDIGNTIPIDNPLPATGDTIVSATQTKKEQMLV
jgi:hypothetical protein